MQGFKEKVWPWVKEILFAFGIWLFITTAVGEARVVPSESMEPTIEIGDRLWTDKLLLHFEPVQRGDIVVFDPPIPSEDPYIKRVIGLPGDKVEVKQGTVFVNGTALKEPYEMEKPNYTFGPVVVPQGKYLMLGDNRNESYDSHYWGFVDAGKIKSRAVFRFWPLSRFGKLN